ncbi:hypothetical protein BANRA_01961 [Klebsiella pneumoniae]|nr:hypothetical protein BANRA_01961 [Klebsiella pneumoniae]
MPVNIFDIPSEEKTSQKHYHYGLNSEFVFVFLLYMYVFLVYFPEYLSKIIMLSGLSYCWCRYS